MAKKNPKPAISSGHGSGTVSPALRKPPLLDLFPAIIPYSSGFLSVEPPHNLYWEQSGNPQGVPIVLLHGGPGAGATPMHRRFFDPDHYRIIIYDQRGAGRSNPLGSLQSNTTQALVDDLEELRKHLKIERWHLFGGSWGSTLALRYALQYPERCVSMILRGIFLCERYEMEWFLYGMRKIFPEAWDQFAGLFPNADHSNLLDLYYERLTGSDPKAAMEAAIRWSLYEGACSSLLPNYETITTEEQKQHALSLARIEAHFFKHELVSGEHSILAQIDRIRKIPATIIQGRYDVICPIQTAYKLHQEWPEADYIVVPDCGHSALDPAMRSRLIEATENYKSLS